MTNKKLALIVAVLLASCNGKTTPPASDGGPDSPVGDSCPAEIPSFGDPCSPEAHCGYGFETCCGHTYPSTVCDCYDGAFSCYSTDACMLPPGSCDAAAPPAQCTSDSDCVSPAGPCQQCSDGGFVCPSAICSSGTCAVDFPACP